MNPIDFTVDSPGRLTPIPEGGYAFVPNPLPQKLGLAPETIARLTEASRSLGLLQGVSQSLPNPKLLVRPFLRREAEVSSRIEGTYATQEELLLFEIDHSSAPEKPDVREVWNYMAALEQGLKLLKELPVCLRMIRTLHETLMRGVRGFEKHPGEFRTRQNWIGHHGQSITDARYVPPSANELQNCLNDFELSLHVHGDHLFLVRLALIHYQFEAMHPFLDGNGRIGRLLLPILLAEKNILSQPLLHLSEFFEKHRNEYYDGLLHVSQKGSWQEWIQFFLRGIAEQSEEAARQTKQLIDLREEYREKVQTISSSALILKLVDALFMTPAIDIPSMAKKLRVTYPTAQVYVSELVKAGMLAEGTGKKRNRVFFASRILAIVNQPTKPKVKK
jgi:Fic family protein